MALRHLPTGLGVVSTPRIVGNFWLGRSLPKLPKAPEAAAGRGLSSLHHFGKDALDLQDRRHEDDQQEYREDKEDGGKEHFHGGFSGSFLGALDSLNSQRLGVQTNGLRNTGPKSFRFTDNRGQIAAARESRIER
jgi:hypothetical protein